VQVFPNLRELYNIELTCCSCIENDDVAKIAIFILNDLYFHTIGCDFGLYYEAAYALSIKGGEEERIKNPRYIPLDLSQLPNSNPFPQTEVILGDKLHLLTENETSEDEIEERDNNNDIFLPCERDSCYSEFVGSDTFIHQALASFNEDISITPSERF
jgi:hypothetical protein